MAEQLRGYLVVKVLEAAGHNGDDLKVWDDSLKDIFVKSECPRLSYQSNAAHLYFDVATHPSRLS